MTTTGPWNEAMTAPTFLLAGFFIVLTIVAFAWSVRALLGIDFSLARLGIAGGITFLSFNPIMNAIVDAEELESGGMFPGLWFFILGVSLSLLTGMVSLVVAEALVPSNTLPGPVYMARAFRRWTRRSSRYWEIGRIVLSHGLLAYALGGRRAELRSPDGRTQLAIRIRQALNDGGVTFVKLGQILSTRRDILPKEFIDEFSSLQDRAEWVPWEAVASTIERELGQPVSAIFAELDEAPLAAASIAQVHAGTLLSGDDVVVKVRRPGVERQVERDLDIVSRLAQRLQRSTSWGRRIGAVQLSEGFSAALREELDLRVEARNIETIARATSKRSDATGLHIPRLYPEHCTGQVLVMERIRGIPLSDAAPEIEARGLDPNDLARALLEALLRQIVIDGTFHADPHPGNVMLLANDRLTLLDFGSVGRVDAALRGALVRLILSFEQGDPIAASDALLDLVERPEGLDEYRLERALGQFMARHLAPGISPDARLFIDLLRIVADFGLAVPPEIAAVFRAIATLEGTLTSIAPDFNIIGEARSFASTHVAEQLRPSAIKRTLTEELTSLIPMLRRLPRRVDRITAALEEGRLNVNVRTLANVEDQRTVARMIHEIVLTALAATSGIMSVMLLGQEGGPQVTAAVSMFDLIGYGLLVAALILAMRVLILVFRPASE